MKPKRKQNIKTALLKVVMVSVLFLFFSVTLDGQTQWTKYMNNPVLTKGPDNWDIIAIGQPAVLFGNDTIKMWYAGVGADMKARICYATSIDGINWVKYNSPVLDIGGPGEWDRGWLDTPEILKDSNDYKLYFYGDTIQQIVPGSSAIGVAVSTDGIHWTKDPGNPILSKGILGEWDCTWIESPAVIHDSVNGEYKMWYNGVDTSTWRIPIGLATSSDGIHWTKYAGNPVLFPGNWGDYDDMWLGTPSVIFKSGKYEMWYTSTCSNSYNYTTYRFDTVNVCFATSTDGINWTKYSGNPLFNTFTSPYDSLIDTGGPWAPDVIFDVDSNMYKMWFETFDGMLLASAPETLSGINNNTFFNNGLCISPNPFSSATTIRSREMLQNATFILFNSSGQIAERKNNINGYEIQVERKKLPNGIYFLQLITNKIILTGKLIIE